MLLYSTYMYCTVLCMLLYCTVVYVKCILSTRICMTTQHNKNFPYVTCELGLALKAYFRQNFREYLGAVFCEKETKNQKSCYLQFFLNFTENNFENIFVIVLPLTWPAVPGLGMGRPCNALAWAGHVRPLAAFYSCATHSYRLTQ